MIYSRCYCRTEVKRWPFSMSLYSWSIKESSCSLCWAGSSSASQAWTHWLRELNTQREIIRVTLRSRVEPVKSRGEGWEVSVYLVPMPWPFVPTRANKERKPSGTNHCKSFRCLLTEITSCCDCIKHYYDCYSKFNKIFQLRLYTFLLRIPIKSTMWIKENFRLDSSSK